VKQLTSQRLSQFARQLAFLFGAGLPIDQSIDLLKASFRYESDLQRSLARLTRAMQQGKALHTAMAAQRGFYPDLFIQLVRAGEHSGALATSLARAADFYADQAAFNRRLMQALTYPLLTILIALIIVLFMLLIIIPSFADIYATLDAEIPVYTRLLIDLSHWLQTSGHWFFAGLVAILLCCIRSVALSPATFFAWPCACPCSGLFCGCSSRRALPIPCMFCSAMPSP
jgi:type II secretory pathway component PulF